MASKKKKTAAAPESLLVVDEKKIPYANEMKVHSKHPMVTHPAEWKILDSLKISQSARFPTKVFNIIQACRLQFHKMTRKKFAVKKIDETYSRIWRLTNDHQLKTFKHKKPNENKNGNDNSKDQQQTN